MSPMAVSPRLLFVFIIIQTEGLITTQANALFAGYWNTGIRDVIASFDNILLAPITNLLPFHIVVLLLAIVTGLYSTVLQSQLMDHEKLQTYRKRMNELKERREAAKERGDKDAL